MIPAPSSRPTAAHSDGAPFEGETGGEFGNFDYFFAGTYFDENGWRENSPSRVYQAFGKVGWQNDKTDFDLSYTYADTSLYGNGATPVSMLDYDYEASYTPDYTANLMSFVNLTGTQFLTDKLLLSGNAFYRHLITNAVNGNTNDSYLDDDYAGPPLDCTAPGASLAALTYCTPGQNATSRLVQNTKGVGLQLTDSQDLSRLGEPGHLWARTSPIRTTRSRRRTSTAASPPTVSSSTPRVPTTTRR